MGRACCLLLVGNLMILSEHLSCVLLNCYSLTLGQFFDMILCTFNVVKYPRDVKLCMKLFCWTVVSASHSHSHWFFSVMLFTFDFTFSSSVITFHFFATFLASFLFQLFSFIIRCHMVSPRDRKGNKLCPLLSVHALNEQMLSDQSWQTLKEAPEQSCWPWWRILFASDWWAEELTASLFFMQLPVIYCGNWNWNCVLGVLVLFNKTIVKFLHTGAMQSEDLTHLPFSREKRNW